MLEWCVVSNIKKYLIDIGYKQVTDPHIILNNRIWFRMRNGSVVGRLISGKGERWMVISNKREHEKNIYVIGNLFNLSGRVIRVWMGEGVMDVIGMQNKLEQSVDESDFTEMNDVEIKYMYTSYGTKLLVAKEVGDDTDFVDFFSVYKGYSIEFVMTPNPQAKSQALTDAQIQMCVDFLSELDFVGAM